MAEDEAVSCIVRLVSIAEEYVGGEDFKELDAAGVTAIKALNAQIKLKQELIKMKQEIERCYDLAKDNALYKLDREEIRWRARADTFWDCVEIIKGIMGG